MPWIFRYFWFVGAAFMLINILIWRRRLAQVVDRGGATRAEVDQFMRWVAVYFVGGPLLVGIIALAAGWTTPFCAGPFQFSDAPRTLVSLLTLAGWIGLLWWIWRGNGAEFLARVAPALGQRPVFGRPYSPRIVRAVVTAVVLFSGVGSVIAWRTMPMPPELGCIDSHSR